MKIGAYGWSFDQIIGAGDFNSDGKKRCPRPETDGTIWIYPGDGTGKAPAPRRIGTGWNVYDTVLGGREVEFRPLPRMVARRPNGSLWAYSGTGMQPNEGYHARVFAVSVA